MNNEIENAIAALADVKSSIAAIIKDGGDPILTVETVSQMQKLVQLHDLCRWTAEYFRQDVDAFLYSRSEIARISYKVEMEDD